MPRKPKKPDLPPYVFVRPGTGSWFVRRNFRTRYKYPNGSWIYTQVVRRCYPHTEEQARLVASQIETEFNAADPPTEPANLTLGEFMAEFVERKKNKVEPKTAESYKWFYEKYFAQHPLASLVMSNIGPRDIQRFYETEQQSGTSAAMIRKIHKFLSMVFNRAVWERVAENNVCRGAELPKAVTVDIEVMDRDQARAFARVCFENPQWLVLAFALETGMRPGEYLALEWKDLNGKLVKVQRAVSFLKSGGYYFKPPKTAKSKRTIALSDKLSEAIKEHRIRQVALIDQLTAQASAKIPKGASVSSAQRERAKRRVAQKRLAAYTTHNLIFPSESGTPTAPHNLGIRDMKAACEKAGIGKFSLYSLRHSAATLMLAAGVDIKTVSEKLGHANPSVTMAVYLHVLDSMRDTGVDKLAEALY